MAESESPALRAARIATQAHKREKTNVDQIKRDNPEFFTYLASLRQVFGPDVKVRYLSLPDGQTFGKSSKA